MLLAPANMTKGIPQRSIFDLVSVHIPGDHWNEAATILGTSKHFRKNLWTRQILIQEGTIFLRPQIFKWVLSDTLF